MNMKIKILIIFMVLIFLIIGSFFIYENIFSSSINEKKEADKTWSLEQNIKFHQRLNLSFFKGIWPAPGGHAMALEKDIEKIKADGVNIFPVAPLFEVYPDGSIKPVASAGWGGRDEAYYVNQIRKAHGEGLAVFLELDPIYIDPSQQEQESLQWLPMPESTKQIFMENFVDVVLHWAEIAEREKVELFSPMNEPNSEILLGDKYSIEWLEKILPLVKEKFKGEIVAKFADVGPKNIAQYGTLQGYDYMAVDIYAIDVPEETFMEFLDSVISQSLANIKKFHLKGFFFGEFGADSTDESFQARIFQKTFEKSWNKTKGYFISGWGPNIDPLDPFTVGFTNKKAEDVLKNWYIRIN